MEGNVEFREKLQDLVFLEAIIQSYRAYEDLQKILFKQKRHALLKEIDAIAGSLQKGESIQDEKNKEQIRKIHDDSLKEVTLIRYEIAIALILAISAAITAILFATIPSFAQGFGSAFSDAIIGCAGVYVYGASMTIPQSAADYGNHIIIRDYH